ncbi:MAG: hypothetical protein K2K02_10530 [Ruminococcus sp.]|nr:hypothetical protein [Ruminococcus sp.]MDE6679461.1 hypothetical protein [Ruminococcus sp.]
MTLLITIVSAVVCTLIWYRNAQHDVMKVSDLCFIYWGASLMWLVDAVFEYAEMGADFFTPSFSDMVNDTFLGISAVTLGLVAWTAKLIIKDPKHILKRSNNHE